MLPLMLPHMLYVLRTKGYIPRGIDPSYISGFLARELQRTAAQALSSSGLGAPSGLAGGGAVLLSKVVSKYGQLMGVDHLALALHELAELQEQGAAGREEVSRRRRRDC